MNNLANCIIHTYKYGVSDSDFLWIWKECACDLKGIDVATAIREARIVDRIGAMPSTIATVPWGVEFWEISFGIWCMFS